MMVFSANSWFILSINIILSVHLISALQQAESNSSTITEPENNQLNRQQIVSTHAQCGRTGPQFTGRRIVGGRSAAVDEFPYQVAIETKSIVTGQWRQFCGGSLIAQEWVVTAAHCVRNKNSRSLRIVGGTNDLTNDNANSVSVIKVIVHERYNPYIIDNDIALIKLSSPISKNVKGFVSPICLPSANSAVPVNQRAFISGFGSTREGGRSSQTMLTTSIPIQPDNQCVRIYGSQYRTPSMMCAGDLNGGKDTCQGDSGGPLATRNANGHYVLIGITSFGQGCARANTPGVYTRVSNYVDWISNRIKIN